MFAVSLRRPDAHLSSHRRPVGERLGHDPPRLRGRRALWHVRHRRRLPDDAAPDFLRNPADGRRRIGDDPDHRSERLGRDGAHAPRRGRPEDGSGDDGRRLPGIGRRRGDLSDAAVDRSDRCGDQLPLRADPRLDRLHHAQGRARCARLHRGQAARRSRPPGTTAGLPPFRCDGASMPRASTFRRSRRSRLASPLA